ncbi:ATP-binding cassette domain-containing protein [Lagierella sp.]|uniref:ATP-binding cassette domain-containing protein n=1 Tax=Lagierella sp. TaxID=2849657 RepID=UPI0026118920|nr:ATP-binding cassette domain-containing protein [Lagierella sp.]
MKIKLNKIKKSFKNNCIIKDATFTLRQGEVSVLKAPNGTGKTTIVNLISGLMIQDSGTIEFDGLTQKDVCIIYGGDKNLYMKNTVDENLYYFGFLRGLRKDKIRSNIQKMKSIFVNYDKLRNTLCEELSHGQKRIVSIFSSIITDNKCIILDEATEGLDQENIDILVNLINEIKKDVIILIVSHDILFVNDLVCNKIVIKNSRIYEEVENEIN